ncbi:hypothetical protein [Pseudoroseomonas cervicalis]|uniref:hypothetical protein n=1 Tax=Teichococcus cervicalis TaxID=204525 RepID=UPI0022F14AAC|nr:hypothetical protein [Pseudoroseomonas cervicalis]WBV41594.1 hypothetical protein PFY06_10080 [Pseudoroseomonas cervicalis]
MSRRWPAPAGLLAANLLLAAGNLAYLSQHGAMIETAAQVTRPLLAPGAAEALAAESLARLRASTAGLASMPRRALDLTPPPPDARPASSRAIRRKLLSEQRDNCLPVVTADATVPAVLCLVLTRFAGPGERVTGGFPGAVWGEEGATTVVHLHLLTESYVLLSLAGPAAARLAQGEGVTVDMVVFRQGEAGASR